MITVYTVAETIAALPDCPHSTTLRAIQSGAWNVIHTVFPDNTGTGRHELAMRSSLGIDEETSNEIIAALETAHARSKWDGSQSRINGEVISVLETDRLASIWRADLAERRERGWIY
jgi:hypothetical protein